MQVAEEEEGVNGVLPSESQRVNRGLGFLGRGQLARFPLARGFGERCKQAPPAATQRFSLLSGLRAAYSVTFVRETATEVPQSGRKEGCAIITA